VVAARLASPLGSEAVSQLVTGCYNGVVTDRARALLKQAMALAEAERAEIAGALLESLEPSSDSGVDEAWREEVRRRLEQLDAGSAELILWEEVREQLLAGSVAELQSR
jgi:putative addiction module component (TIGR02574 family)